MARRFSRNIGNRILIGPPKPRFLKRKLRNRVAIRRNAFGEDVLMAWKQRDPPSAKLCWPQGGAPPGIYLIASFKTMRGNLQNPHAPVRCRNDSRRLRNRPIYLFWWRGRGKFAWLLPYISTVGVSFWGISSDGAFLNLKEIHFKRLNRYLIDYEYNAPVDLRRWFIWYDR